jgi:hypothetical protein
MSFEHSLGDYGALLLHRDEEIEQLERKLSACKDANVRHQERLESTIDRNREDANDKRLRIMQLELRERELLTDLHRVQRSLESARSLFGAARADVCSARGILAGVVEEFGPMAETDEEKGVILEAERYLKKTSGY